ncbi:MAG TPA: hypothetical protein VIK04_12900 [Solirubrobacteraceae bacterium]
MNGERWIVTAAHDDGSITACCGGGGGQVVLPAAYVAEHVELAYAATAHRAQGRTVDTAHALVSSNRTREVLYVAATRGRQSNRLYVDTASDPDAATGHRDLTEKQTMRQVLVGILAREGADRSTHETIPTRRTPRTASAGCTPSTSPSLAMPRPTAGRR